MNDIISTPNIKDEIRTKRPRLHKVILVNDDYTPREFVVMVLKAEFRTDGRCLCGAVRFVATGEPIGVAWCHCQSCRKHSGAPVSVFVAFTHDAYTVTEGEITKFNSSPGRWRGFCARCGSTLTCEGERSTEMHFHVGAFDNAAGFEPTQHIFPEERLPWLHLGEA